MVDSDELRAISLVGEVSLQETPTNPSVAATTTTAIVRPATHGPLPARRHILFTQPRREFKAAVTTLPSA